MAALSRPCAQAERAEEDRQRDADDEERHDGRQEARREQGAAQRELLSA